MEYNKTGIFTEKQIKLAKDIANKIKELRKSGCDIICKGTYLNVYKTEDMDNAAPIISSFLDYHHPVKNISAGKINDCGADDSEYFKRGYITD